MSSNLEQILFDREYEGLDKKEGSNLHEISEQLAAQKLLNPNELLKRHGPKEFIAQGEIFEKEIPLEKISNEEYFLDLLKSFFPEETDDTLKPVEICRLKDENGPIVFYRADSTIPPKGASSTYYCFWVAGKFPIKGANYSKMSQNTKFTKFVEYPSVTENQDNPLDDIHRSDNWDKVQFDPIDNVRIVKTDMAEFTNGKWQALSESE